jgi:hypothetical protein
LDHGSHRLNMDDDEGNNYSDRDTGLWEIRERLREMDKADGLEVEEEDRWAWERNRRRYRRGC